MKILISAIILNFVFLGSQLCQADITTGLVGWWKLDDGSGTSAIDSSGNGNTGTLHNSPVWIPGKIGTALSFDGTSQYVTTSVNVTLTSATFSAWVKRTGSESGYTGILFSRGSSVAGMGFTSSNQLGYDWNDNATGYNWATGLVPPLNQWALVVIVVSPSGTTAYMDSSSGLQTTSLVLPQISAVINNLQIGEDPYGGRFFQGSIDDVRFYSRSLLAADVLQLYNLGLGDHISNAVIKNAVIN